MNLFRRLPVLVLLAPLVAVAAPPTKVIYRITGTAVSTRDGAPVPYCRMQISESTNAAPTQAGSRRGPRPEPNEVDADVRGHFQITLEHPGAYVLTGSAREYRRQNYDSHENFFSSIVLTPTEPAANVTFRMERDAAITGLVLDEAGEPVRSAQVAAEVPGQLEQRPGRSGRGAEGRPAGFSQTDDRGRYEISGLAPGAYRVRVTAQPWYAQGVRFLRPSSAGPSPDPSLDVVYPTTWYPGVEDETIADLLRLSGGEERQADFHLAPSPAVHLVVPRPDPPPAADGQPRPQRGAYLIKISPAGGGFAQNQTTNGNTQEFGGLSPGVYEIHTSGPDGRPDPEAKQFRVLPGTSGVVDLSTASMLTKVTLHFDGVEPNQAGQITFMDAVTGRMVNPENGFGYGFGRRRDPDAPERERAVYLSPGKWEVQTPANASTYLTGLDGTGLSVAGSTIEVGEQAATLLLHMGTGRADLSGIASAGDKPIQGAMVLLVPALLGAPGSTAEVERDQTNSDGSFLLRNVVPGKYILLAIDHGWNVQWHDLPTLAGYLARGTPVEIAQKEKVKRNVQVIEP